MQLFYLLIGRLRIYAEHWTLKSGTECRPESLKPEVKSGLLLKF